MAKEYRENFNTHKDLKYVVEDFKDLNFNDGGYEMAKELESKGYNINSMIVEHLDCFNHEYDYELRGLVKQWVEAHNITPKYQKGDKVIINTNFSRIQKKDMELYITRVYKESAQYAVSDDKDYSGGYVYNYEMLEEHTQLINQ